MKNINEIFLPLLDCEHTNLVATTISHTHWTQGSPVPIAVIGYYLLVQSISLNYRSTVPVHSYTYYEYKANIRHHSRPMYTRINQTVLDLTSSAIYKQRVKKIVSNKIKFTN
jgi:hypothetical protein